LKLNLYVYPTHHNDILENYDDYRARVEEYRARVLSREYRWDRIALTLVELIYSSHSTHPSMVV